MFARFSGGFKQQVSGAGLWDMTLFYFSYLDANCSPSLPPSQHHLLAQRLRLCLGCGFGGGRRNKALRKLQLMPRFPLGRSLGGEKNHFAILLNYKRIFLSFFYCTLTTEPMGFLPWKAFPAQILANHQFYTVTQSGLLGQHREQAAV